MSDQITNKEVLGEKPLVTLALITYNQSQYIKEAVESALAQTYSPMEIIISDDFSTDDTFKVISEIVSQYHGPHVVILNRNHYNLGLVSNINVVVGLSKGEIICWAAGDDISLPGKIEALVNPLIEDCSLYGTHSYINEIDENGNFIRIRRPSIPKLIESPEQVVRDSIQVISQSHAFRRSVFDKFGPISTLVTNESPVMAFREACLGKILLIEQPLTNYRIGVGVSTRRGQTVEELSILEPLKYAGWWASAYKQIDQDASVIELAEKLKTLINKRNRLYENIFQVNATPMNISALYSSVFNCGFFRVLKAFFRRNAPLILLKYIYQRRGWLI